MARPGSTADGKGRMSGLILRVLTAVAGLLAGWLLLVAFDRVRRGSCSAECDFLWDPPLPLPRAASRVQRLGWPRLLGAAIAASMLLSMVAISPPPKASAAPVFSYFPSPSPTDGRMLSIAGNGLQTLGGNSVTLSFSVANTQSNFQLGFFDGKDRTVWDSDTSTVFPTQFDLYEDPLGNGTGSVLAASWSESTMTANSWKDFTVNTAPSAKSPSGNYFYRLTIHATTSAAAYNNFKVRVEGATYITPTSVFGLMAAKASGITTDSYYDGSWDFSMVVPNGATYVGTWDGDFDVANDTNDTNTPDVGIPSWSPTSAIAEGVHAGNPPDDNTVASGNRRSPNVNYEIDLPDGTPYMNANPSGNTEWEYFRLDTAAWDANVMDYHVTTLPAGVYHIRLHGMDWKNLCAMKFDYPIVGYDASGTPLIPPAPFDVGDTVWNDINPDGVKGPGENGIAGVLINLVDSVSGAIVGTGTTDANGTYNITAWNGTYRVAPAASNYATGGALFGFRPTTAATQTITVTNANIGTADFGEQLIPRISVTPDQAQACAPNDIAPYSFTVQNNAATTFTVDFATSSSLGFANSILTASGLPTSAVTLRSGEATTIVVRINVPVSATIGSQDITRLTATLRGDGANASAIAQTTVRQAVDISPDNSGASGPGTSVDYSHVVVNDTSTTQTITLSSADTRGWPISILATDGVTVIGSVSVPPNGGSKPIIVRVGVPSGATTSTVDTTTVTAQMGALSDTAVDITTVSSLLTYGTPAYTTPDSAFVLGDPVYGRASTLTSGTAYYFVWRDSTGTTQSVSTTRTPGASGMATDTYSITPTATVGTWSVEVHRSSTRALVSGQSFTVSYVAAISALYATDASTVGTNTTVTSAEDNSSIATITASSIDYRIWWDSNANGVFDAGDIYIAPGGGPVPYSGSGGAVTHTTSGVTVVPFTTYNDPGWQMSNITFPNQGTYNITAVWKTSGGMQIDTKTSQFFSVPTLGEFVRGIHAPRLPWIALGAIVWAAALWRLRRKRRWLSFYGLGSLGTVLLALFLAQATGLDTLLESVQAGHVAWLAALLHMNIAALPPSALAIQNHVGWGVFDIVIECSALLEMAALVGLVGFYPAFGRGRKTAIIASGLAATYVINVARILLIVGMIASLGTGWVFVAHAVVGRIFFFTGIVVVYWLLVTMPTVRAVSRRLEAAPSSAEEDDRDV
jgi:exosortase family protein XrtG